MMRTFRYRAQLTHETEANALRWLELCRTLYNLGLEQRILVYQMQAKKSFSCYRQQAQLPALKEAFPEFAVVGSQCLQDVLQRLDRAFQAFFHRCREGKSGFPRFKGRGRYDSFTLTQAGWKLDGRDLRIRNVGRFKLRLSRPILGKIKTVTVRRTKTCKWFVSFSCANVPEREFPQTDRSVGIDVGINAFAVDSDGGVVENPQTYRRAMAALRRGQRMLCRRKRGSVRRSKAQLQVAKLHERLVNQRLDFLHKTANHYVRTYDDIAIEKLNITGMVQNRHLALSIHDASWGLFFTLLSYKAAEAGRTLVKVTPHGTSQQCSRCGRNVPKTLSTRRHSCPHCGLVLDRDENAALNIKARAGQALQARTSEVSDVA